MWALAYASSVQVATLPTLASLWNLALQFLSYSKRGNYVNASMSELLRANFEPIPECVIEIGCKFHFG